MAQQPTAAPVPSIEELKRQLEAKREELKREHEKQEEAKRQLEVKAQPKPKPPLAVPPQPEGGAGPELAGKAQPETTPPSEAEPQPEAKPQPKGKQPLKKPPPTKSTPGEPESGAPVLVASAEKPAPPSDVTKAPPPAKNISPVKLEPNSSAAADSCPYPAAARDRGDTGTVVLLIYVAPDGRAVDTRVESSSGSEVLDEAAAGCVKEFGHFVPKRVGPRAEAGWFRMRYKWSFGD
ncbi:MAG: energy transducer TonB [Steroidobacteraceae bacterium]